MKLKLGRYEKFGIKEYWVVDPELETIKVYRLSAGHYGKALERSREAGDTLTTPLLPGFKAALKDIFKR
jgi:Uma2 family endonuclease